jgi:hypothetical protein
LCSCDSIQTTSIFLLINSIVFLISDQRKRYLMEIVCSSRNSTTVCSISLFFYFLFFYHSG